MELSHEAVKDLIAPYVLGAVAPEEEREIRSHILTCDECTQEAESFAMVTASLPHAADSTPLPAGFVDRVVTQVHDARPVVTLPARAGQSRLYGVWSRFGAIATAGLLVLAVVAGALLVNQHSALEQRQKVLAILLHHQRDGIELKGPADAIGKVVPTSRGSLFVAAGMHKPPEAHTYQLWLIKNGTPESAGTFSVKGDLVVLESGRSLAGVDSAAITIEPAGGSKHPTTQPITTAT
jgi:anti-sigma-K factor RskA